MVYEMLHIIKIIENKTSSRLNKSYVLDLSAKNIDRAEFCIFIQPDDGS